MTIIKLTDNQVDYFQQLISIFKEVFEQTNPLPSTSYLQQLLQNKQFWVLVAVENGKVVGGLTVYILPQYYLPKNLAYIYDIGVLPALQGKGIGKKLLEQTHVFCKEQQIEAAYVEAEYADKEAIEFYRKTNATFETKAIHFTYQYSNR